MKEVLLIIMMGIISFFPIVIWGYLFSYIDDNTLNKKRFFSGILAGSASVFPVLYFEEILQFLKIDFLYFFGNVEKFSLQEPFVGIFGSLFIFVFFLSILSFLLFGAFPYSKQRWSDFGKKNLLYLLYVLLFSLIIYFIIFLGEKIPSFSLSGEYFIEHRNAVYNSLKLIILYYLINAFNEEISKFFFFSHDKKLKILSIEKLVLGGVFVALGFSFLENIYYFYNIYQDIGWKQGFFSSYIGRSIFSVFLHVISTSILAYFFGKAFLLYRNNYQRGYIKLLFLGIFLATFIHALFNISLAYNLNIMLIIYLIGGYLYFTSLFYKE